MHLNGHVRIRGISILELLIALGCLVLLAAFVAPGIRPTTAETEMQKAIENLQSSIQLARQTAQVYKMEVILHLKTDRDAANSLSLTLPSLSQSALRESWDFLEAETKEYQFPGSIHLMADQNTIHFDDRGQVDAPAHLVLVSTSNQDLVKHVVIR